MNIILTIAISTYNRCEFLEKCLNSILLQEGFENQIHEVEIIISDNASSDETEHFVRQFMAENTNYNIIYCRNSQNLGMDGNFLNCINKSNGCYIHMMSDDDIMLQGALSSILFTIKSEEPDFIHLNSGGFDNNSIVDYNKMHPRFDFDSNLLIYNKDEFLNKVGIYITFLSSIIYKKELIDQVEDKERFLGTYFLQSHVELLSLKNANKICIIGKCCIGARGGNTGGYNLYKIWIKEYKRLLLKTAIEAGFSKKYCKLIYIKSSQIEVTGFIVNFRFHNTGFDLNGRKYIIYNTWMYPMLCIRLYMAALTPISCFKIIKKIKNFINKI